MFEIVEFLPNFERVGVFYGRIIFDCLNYQPGRGVTANMPLLGRGDSGFESRRPDMNLYKKILNFFDKFEDHVRAHLSRFPILYTFIGGIAIVLFWRGVWHTADILQAKGGWLGWIFYEPINLIIVVLILLATGLFVSYFIGDTILISGIKQEKKTTDRTEKEVKEEEGKIVELRSTIKDMKKEVDEIKDFVEHVQTEHHAN